VSPQLSLTYDASYVGRETWAAQLEVIRLAVGHLGLKEVSFALDVSGSMVSDALNERDRKRWAAEWTHVLVAMLVKKNDETALGFVRQLFGAALEPTPFTIEDDAELTAEEIVARIKRDDQGRALLARIAKRGR
jgi:hypothetical protein